MSRPPHKLRPKDLTPSQVGALLVAFHGPLRLTRRGGKPPRWTSADGNAFIDRHTFQRMLHMGLVKVQGDRADQTASMTPTGLRLADLLVTLSREIAAGIAGRDARSFTPLVEEPVTEAPDETPALRLNTHPTPRDVIGAQLRRAGKVIA